MKSVYFSITSLTIMFLISFNLVLSCTWVYESVYWDDKCTGDPEIWYDFAAQVASLTDVICAVGPSSQYGHGNEYWQLSILGSCENKNDVVWRNISRNQWPPDALEGEICEARWEIDCGNSFGGTPDYRFDTDERGCVYCIDIPPYGKRQGEIDKCGSSGEATYACEEACGADPECDEQIPGTGNCDGNCDYIPPMTTSSTTTTLPTCADIGGICDRPADCTDDYECYGAQDCTEYPATCCCVSISSSSSSSTTIYIPEDCSGDPYPCLYYNDSSSCETAGCSWIGECKLEPGYKCCGSSSSCVSPFPILLGASNCNNIGLYHCSGLCCVFANPSTCDSRTGCEWVSNDQCDGTPSPCSSYTSQSSCETAGCSWSGVTTSPIPPSGGCPTLFVYDGKDYVKERKSRIHSEEGVDTVDEIILKTMPIAEGGIYFLSLKETTLPEHSYIDSVRLFVGGEEVEFISAWHSRYGDVTSILKESDDIRTDTKVFDEIELKFLAPELEGEFLFEIEGYNPAGEILGRFWWGGPPLRIKIDVAQLVPIAIIAALAIIVVVFAVMKFFAKK